MATAKKDTVVTEEKEVKVKKATPKAKTTTAKKATGEVKVEAKKVEGEVKATKKAPAAKKEAKVANDVYVARLRKQYREEIAKAMMTKYGYSSVMEVPEIKKIVVNIGVGDATQNSKLLDDAVRDLAIITGQKPVITKAKKSIASFKLREGQEIGCKVTLRGNRMYEFLDKLISISLPRVRDFRGVSKNAFDGRGNYTLGIKEQLIFPEIDYDKVGKVRGMDIVIVTSAKTDDEAATLLTEMGMPFHR